MNTYNFIDEVQELKINHQKEKDWEKKFNIEECKWD